MNYSSINSEIKSIQPDITLFEKNFNLFSKRFSALANSINKNQLIDNILKQIIPNTQIFPSKSGTLTLKINDRLLHSAYSPEKEANSLLTNQEILKSDNLVFFSFGLMYSPVLACKQYKTKTIILVEPILEYAFLSFLFVDLTDLFNHEKLICLFSATPDEVIGVLEKKSLDDYYFIKNKSQMMHCDLWYSSLIKLIERNKEKQMINNNTYKKFGKLWITNTCKNLPMVISHSGITILKDFAKGQRACVLAAGPSLQETLKYIKQIQQKSLIICVDTALKSCLLANITPDFVIVVDPQYWNSRHLDFTQTKNSVLITESAVYPRIFENNWREIFFCKSIYPLGQYLEQNIDRGELGAGGSVATTAWDFARYIGCTEIYMAGLDLGYPNKQTHNKGCTFEERSNICANKLHNSETNSTSSIFSVNTITKKNYVNGDIQTDSRMLLYAWWFESKCATFSNIKTFSFNDKSLHIPGISLCKVSDFLLLPDLKEDFRINLNLLLNTKTSSNDNLSIFENKKKLLITLEKYINNTCSLSDDLQQILKPFISSCNDDVFTNQNKYINSIKRLIKLLDN